MKADFKSRVCLTTHVEVVEFADFLSSQSFESSPGHKLCLYHVLFSVIILFCPAFLINSFCIKVK